MNNEQVQLNPQYVMDELLRQLNEANEKLAVMNAVNRTLQEQILELQKDKPEDETK